MNDLMDLVKNNLDVAGLLAGSAAIISIFVQNLKRKIAKLKNERVVYLVTNIVTVVAVLLQALFSAPQESVAQLGENALKVLAFLQPVYLYLVKPASGILRDARALREGQVTATETTTVVATPTEVNRTVESTVQAPPAASDFDD